MDSVERDGAILVALRDMEEMCVFGPVPKLNFFSVNTVVGCQFLLCLLVAWLRTLCLWNFSPDVYQ
jgi:hypothetical protein